MQKLRLSQLNNLPGYVGSKVSHPNHSYRCNNRVDLLAGGIPMARWAVWREIGGFGACGIIPKSCPWMFDLDPARLRSLCLRNFVPVKLHQGTWSVRPAFRSFCSWRPGSLKAPCTWEHVYQEEERGGTWTFLCHAALGGESRSERPSVYSEGRQRQDGDTKITRAETKPPKHIRTHLPTSYPTRTTKLATHSKMCKFAVRTKAAVNISRSQ